MEKKHSAQVIKPEQEQMDKPLVNVDEELVRQLDSDEEREDNTMKKMVISVFVLLVLLGVGTGYVLAGGSAIKLGSKSSSNTTGSSSAKAVGSNDAQTFKDSAIGQIDKGGLDGEGTHQLVRDGGPSQTVYLLSSVVDLDQYVGKKVKVWGQTVGAKKAAWLMDVGKIEVQ